MLKRSLVDLELICEGRGGGESSAWALDGFLRSVKQKTKVVTGYSSIESLPLYKKII